jgi:hypothetical protein
MRQAICYMPAHSHQRTNHRRDTYSRICLAHRSVNVTQRAYSCLAPCNKPGRYRADLLASQLRISFLHHDSGHPSRLAPTDGASRGPVGRGGHHHRPRAPSRHRGRAHSGHITSRSAVKRCEPPRSQPQVRSCTRRVRHGQRDACAGPGLQTNSLPV